MALTRAEKQLKILYTQSRTIWGREQFTIPSRFINEMGVNTQKEQPIASNNKVDDSIEYQIGEKIKHIKYGKGVIVGVTDDTVIIAFKKEVKKFIKGHTSIQKL